MSGRSSLFDRAIRHPDVFVASVRHHVLRVVSSPIRTIVSIVFVYAFVVALVTFANAPDEVRAFLEADPTVGGLWPLLPPVPVLLVLAGASIVGVPFGTVVRGVRRDLRSSRRRRQRRAE